MHVQNILIQCTQRMYLIKLLKLLKITYLLTYLFTTKLTLYGMSKACDSTTRAKRSLLFTIALFRTTMKAWKKQSKSLDMLQLLLDYIAVLRTSMQSIVKYRVAWSVIQSVGLSPSEPCKNG